MKKIIIILVTILLISTAIMPTTLAKNTRTRGPFIEKIKEFFQGISFINNTLNWIKNIFGLVEAEPEDEHSDEKDNDNYVADITYYPPYQYISGGDPQDATPTDTSISVDIKNFDITYEEDEDGKFEFDIFFNGKTSGDVYCCLWVMVAYFDDGSNSYYNIWNGPRENRNIKYEDIRLDLTFFGTGANGKTDWSEFEGRQLTTGKISSSQDVVFEYPDNEDYEKRATDFVLYVRSFNDKELKEWNQDSISLFDDLPNQILGKSEGIGSGTPGFEIIALIGAIIICLILLNKKKQ